MSENILQKVDLALGQLEQNGGLLDAEQNDQFIKDLIEQPTIIRECRTVPMNAPERKINKIGIGQRMLRAARQQTALQSGGTLGRALSEAERTAPTTSQITIQTSEVIAELRIPYEVLEDNIERGRLQNTILQLIATRAATDLEELVINGDKSLAGTDDYLAQQDGVLKLIMSNTMDASPFNDMEPDIFNNTVKSLPKRFRRNKSTMRLYLPMDIEQDYRNQQAKRGTNLGDVTLTGDAPLKVFGVPMKGVALLPDTSGIYTTPQNMIFGIQRNIRIETDKDISAREIIIVLTARVAVGVEEEKAAVKILNLPA